MFFASSPTTTNNNDNNSPQPNKSIPDKSFFDDSYSHSRSDLPFFNGIQQTGTSPFRVSGSPISRNSNSFFGSLPPPWCYDGRYFPPSSGFSIPQIYPHMFSPYGPFMYPFPPLNSIYEGMPSICNQQINKFNVVNCQIDQSPDNRRSESTHFRESSNVDEVTPKSNHGAAVPSNSSAAVATINREEKRSSEAFLNQGVHNSSRAGKSPPIEYSEIPKEMEYYSAVSGPTKSKYDFRFVQSSSDSSGNYASTSLLESSEIAKNDITNTFDSRDSKLESTFNSQASRGKRSQRHMQVDSLLALANTTAPVRQSASKLVPPSSSQTNLRPQAGVVPPSLHLPLPPPIASTSVSTSDRPSTVNILPNSLVKSKRLRSQSPSIQSTREVPSTVIPEKDPPAESRTRKRKAENEIAVDGRNNDINNNNNNNNNNNDELEEMEPSKISKKNNQKQSTAEKPRTGKSNQKPGKLSKGSSSEKKKKATPAKATSSFWQPQEVVALYAVHQSLDGAVVVGGEENFWKSVSLKLKGRGFARSAADCKDRWTLALREAQLRREKKNSQLMTTRTTSATDSESNQLRQEHKAGTNKSMDDENERKEANEGESGSADDTEAEMSDNGVEFSSQSAVSARQSFRKAQPKSSKAIRHSDGDSDSDSNDLAAVHEEEEEDGKMITTTTTRAARKQTAKKSKKASKGVSFRPSAKGRKEDLPMENAISLTVPTSSGNTAPPSSQSALSLAAHVSTSNNALQGKKLSYIEKIKQNAHDLMKSLPSSKSSSSSFAGMEPTLTLTKLLSQKSNAATASRSIRLTGADSLMSSPPTASSNSTSAGSFPSSMSSPVASSSSSTAASSTSLASSILTVAKPKSTSSSSLTNKVSKDDDNGTNRSQHRKLIYSEMLAKFIK